MGVTYAALWRRKQLYSTRAKMGTQIRVITVSQAPAVAWTKFCAPLSKDILDNTFISFFASDSSFNKCTFPDKTVRRMSDWTPVTLCTLTFLFNNSASSPASSVLVVYSCTDRFTLPKDTARLLQPTYTDKSYTTSCATVSGAATRPWV